MQINSAVKILAICLCLSSFDFGSSFKVENLKSSSLYSLTDTLVVSLAWSKSLILSTLSMSDCYDCEVEFASMLNSYTLSASKGYYD